MDIWHTFNILAYQDFKEKVFSLHPTTYHVSFNNEWWIWGRP